MSKGLVVGMATGMLTLSVMADEVRISPSIGGVAKRLARFDRHLTINHRTGEQVDGQLFGREDTVVYQNDAETLGYSYGNVAGTFLGDHHSLSRGGLLNTFTFSVVNGSAAGALESCDATIEVYTGFYELLGTIEVQGITFDPPLAEGEGSSVTLTDLAGAGLTLAPNIYTAISLRNLTGGADTVGPALYINPTVGWSPSFMYEDASWIELVDEAEEFIFSDTYNVIAVSEPGEEQALATTGSLHGVQDGAAYAYVGYISGERPGAGFPQRRAAIPFRLDAESTIREIDTWWFEFEPGDEVRFMIWTLGSKDIAPVEEDLIGDYFLAPYDPSTSDEPLGYLWTDRLDEELTLPAGDYYFTLKTTSNDGRDNALAWFGGGTSQVEDLEKDYFWRAQAFPDPGFVFYNAGGDVTAPPAMVDPDDPWNLCFTLRGLSGSNEPCQGIVCGDSNGDGGVDFDDIDCFVAALIGLDNWLSCGTAWTEAEFVCANSTNKDGSVDFDDIDSFVSALINGECP